MPKYHAHKSRFSSLGILLSPAILALISMTPLPAAASVNGACGPASGKATATPPDTGLCNAGTYEWTSGSGPWYWECIGSGGGSTASCSASLASSNAVNGACGPSSGTTVSSPPDTGLCNAGTYEYVSGTGPWYWECIGSSGGSTASCSASLASANSVNGACGPSSGTTVSSPPDTGLCNAGTYEYVSGTGPWYWECIGSSGGSVAGCLAALASAKSVNGACGSLAGVCTTGSPADVTSSTWSCTGSDGGSTVNCSIGTSSGPAPATGAYYSAESFWNTPIAAGATVDPNSANIVATALTPYASGSALSNNAFGIGYISATSSNTVYTVTSLSGYVGPGQPTSVKFPIPSGVVPSSGSDGHLVVIGPPGTAYANEELDMWEACPPNTSYPSAGYSFPCSTGTHGWQAGSVFISQINGWGANGVPGSRAFGMYAAGFSGMGGIITPADIASGVIKHALSLMTPETLTQSGAPYIGPATMSDGRHSGYAIPEGAHIRLNPSFNVAAQSWPAYEKMIAVALQTYGAYVSDTGGSMALYGATDNNAGNKTWASVGVPYDATLANIPWSEMQVLELSSVPVDNVGP
jgi:hypothetical protein